MNKFFALALVAVMLLSSGCNNSQADNTNNPVINGNEATDNASPDTSENEQDLPDTPDDENIDVSIDNPTLNSGEDNKPDSDSTTAESGKMTDMYITYSSEYDVNGDLVQFTVYEYDENGNKLRQTTSGQDGDFNDTCTYEYDSAGLVTKCSIRSGDEYIEISYDELGNETSYRTYNTDGTIRYGKYILNFDAEYNSAGQEIKRTSYESADSHSVATTEYNSSGLVTSYKQITSNGKLLHQVTYEYDEKGRRTRWAELFSENPEFDHDVTVKYLDNDDGTYSATTTYTGTDKVIGFEVFDANGNTIQIHMYVEDELYNIHFTEYNENGNITYWKTLDANYELVSETTSEYSDNGELTHRYRTEFYEIDGKMTESTSETTVTYSADPEADGYYKKELTVETLDGEYFGESASCYDNAGNLIKSITIAPTTDIEVIYEYDSHGNLIKILHYSNGILVYSTVNEYIQIEGAWHEVK